MIKPEQSNAFGPAAPHEYGEPTRDRAACTTVAPPPLGAAPGTASPAGGVASAGGSPGDPHLSPFHLASYAAIGGGFWLIAVAWRHLHAAAQADRLATTGPYAWVRHPQYDGFLLVMIGFLLQWPTIPTLMMFPVLVYVYARLARSEERDVADQFGPTWNEYAARTPVFVPHLRSRPQTVPTTPHARDRLPAWHHLTPPTRPTGGSPPLSTDGSHETPPQQHTPTLGGGRS